MTRSQTAAALEIRELNEQLKALTTQVEELADSELRLQEELGEAVKQRDEYEELYDEQVDENAQLLAANTELREQREEGSNSFIELCLKFKAEKQEYEEELRCHRGLVAGQRDDLLGKTAENEKLRKENARLREGYEKLKAATNPPPGFAGHKPKLWTPADFTRSANA